MLCANEQDIFSSRSDIVNTYRIVSRKALCNSPNFHIIEKLYLWNVHRLIAYVKFAHFLKYPFSSWLMKQSASYIAKPAIIYSVEINT